MNRPELHRAVSALRAGAGTLDAAAAGGLSARQTYKLLNDAGLTVRDIRADAGVRTLHEVEELFGVSWTTVRRWVAAGALVTSYATAEPERKARRRQQRVVTRAALVDFLRVREHWPVWDVARITDLELRRIAATLRAGAGGRWVTIREVAALLNVPESTLRHQVNAGAWPPAGWETVRAGNRNAFHLWLPHGWDAPPVHDRRSRGRAEPAGDTTGRRGE